MKHERIYKGLGHSKTGRWTVSVYTETWTDDRNDYRVKVQPVAHSIDREAAFEAAAQRPEPWGYVWKRYFRHAIAKAEGVTPDEIYQRTPKDPAHIL